MISDQDIVSKEKSTDKKISILHDVPDFVPIRDAYGDWLFRIFDRSNTTCKNYLSPNRRDFYLILFLDEAIGVFTIGLKTYIIKEPTLLFVHPSDIISWQSLATKNSGFFCMLKQEFIDINPSLKWLVSKYNIFRQKEKSIIGLSAKEVQAFNGIFKKIFDEFYKNGPEMYLSIGAYLQLILIEAERIGQFPEPSKVDTNFQLVHSFFELLEENITQATDSDNFEIKTKAADYAHELTVHPNYLNALLKKYTGQTISTLIKNRILEEAKALLLFTNHSLQDISARLGFSDQPNFNYFFKQKTGSTPKKFREVKEISDDFTF